LFLVVAAIPLISFMKYRHHLDLARAEVERGHFATAKHELQYCQSSWFADRELALLSAQAARRSGAWDDAKRQLDDYSRSYGDDEDLVGERLMLLATQGELDAAAPRLLNMIARNHASSRLAREALIVGQLFRFRWFEAERNIDAWLQVAPDDPLAWFHRGKLHEQRQLIPDAIAAYRETLERDLDHDEARLRLITLLLQQRSASEALPHLERLRTRLPDHPEIRIQLAKAYSLLGLTDESRRVLDDTLVRFPDFAPALAERGAQAIQAGDDSAAEDLLSRALRLAPGDYTARSQYAAVLERLGKPHEAAKIKETLRKLEEDQERIAELIAGPLRTRPNDPAVPHEIGMIAMRSGQFAEANRWLLNALSVDPDHGPSHQALAGYHQAAGNPALAAKHRALAKQHTKKPG